MVGLPPVNRTVLPELAVNVPPLRTVAIAVFVIELLAAMIKVPAV